MNTSEIASNRSGYKPQIEANVNPFKDYTDFEIPLWFRIIMLQFKTEQFDTENWFQSAVQIYEFHEFITSIYLSMYLSIYGIYVSIYRIYLSIYCMKLHF